MTSVNGNGAAPRSHFLTLEFIGEVFLLAIVAALFVYMYLDSVEWDEGSLQWLPWRLDWSDGGWLLPRITILFGTPFWFWRAVSLFRAGASTTGGQIMDTGFLDTDDPATTIAWRWVRIFGTTAGLMIGVWVLGFHIAVPAYTMFYLIMFGKMKWYWTIVPRGVLRTGHRWHLWLHPARGVGHAGRPRLADHRLDMERRHRRLA